MRHTAVAHRGIPVHRSAYSIFDRAHCLEEITQRELIVVGADNRLFMHPLAALREGGAPLDQRPALLDFVGRLSKARAFSCGNSGTCFSG